MREVREFDLHGTRYVDVTVAYPEEVLETARLGGESVPDRLQQGERVLVTRAVNMIVSIRRP